MVFFIGLAVVGLVFATIAINYGVAALAVAINRSTDQRERQASESLEAQRAVASELCQLRRMLDGSDPKSGKATIHIGGRVIASSRP